MDVDGLPIVGAAIDLTKVASVHPKRNLAFLNHFICHTINFLNKFSCVCETKLEEISTRIQRIETTLSILEAKLSTIPGLEDINTASTETTGVQQQPPKSDLPPEVPNDAPTPAITAKEPEEQESIDKGDLTTSTVSKDPRYSKYFKLIQVGVPAMALKPKMLAEGLNPDLLDTPNAPAPPQRQELKSLSESEEESASDFSD